MAITITEFPERTLNLLGIDVTGTTKWEAERWPFKATVEYGENRLEYGTTDGFVGSLDMGKAVTGSHSKDPDVVAKNINTSAVWIWASSDWCKLAKDRWPEGLPESEPRIDIDAIASRWTD